MTRNWALEPLILETNYVFYTVVVYIKILQYKTWFVSIYCASKNKSNITLKQ